MVKSVISKLEAHPDVLANTYLFYTSDNGYHIGQHRLPPGKTCNKEEDINIPFLARGPGIAAGEVATFPTSHTDLVPTFFELAGIPLHEDFDGEPIPLTKKRQNSRKPKHEHVNVEFWGEGLAEGTVYDNLGMQSSNPRARALEITDIKAQTAGQFDKNTYKTVRVVGDDYDFSYSVWCTNEHELYDIKVSKHKRSASLSTARLVLRQSAGRPVAVAQLVRFKLNHVRRQHSRAYGAPR